VNYKDEEKELDQQIQDELRRLRGTRHQQSPTFSSHEELQTLLKNSPIRKIVRNLPLSSYLRQTRTSLGATAEVFAAALDLPVATVQQLESKHMLPWTIDPRVIAQVAESLRLHVTALKLLSKHSHTIAFVSRQLPDPDLAKQQMLEWLEKVKAELKNRGVGDLLQ
jgi:transcriptional regulator with XRE-family HTH domain